jgi:hypothetical protein
MHFLISMLPEISAAESATAPPTVGMDNHNYNSEMMITKSTVSDDSAARLGD